MRLLDDTQLVEDRAAIQVLHGRLGEDLAKCMAYGSGNFWYIDFLNKKNQLISNYLEILSLFDIKGDETITNQYNVLTIADIESIIDDCYRQLEKWNIVNYD